MTQHIMTNGIEINGTTGTVATTEVMLSTVVAAHDLCLNVRTERERCRKDLSVDAYCDADFDVDAVSGKRLSKPSSAPQSSAIKRELPLAASQQPAPGQNCSCGQISLADWQDGVFRNAGELPAAAWASFVMSRNESHCSVSL